MKFLSSVGNSALIRGSANFLNLVDNWHSPEHTEYTRRSMLELIETQLERTLEGITEGMGEGFYKVSEEGERCLTMAKGNVSSLVNEWDDKAASDKVRNLYVNLIATQLKSGMKEVVCFSGYYPHREESK